jgi:hypothetical protein
MSNAITVFNASVAIVTFTNKKGDELAISAEGALFKGGAALLALKDAAIDSAFTKAVNGKYRSAADIIGAAFPGIQKACEKLLGTAYANKVNMSAFLGGVELVQEPAKGWSAKQVNARMLVRALRGIPSLAPTEAGEVIENEATA